MARKPPSALARTKRSARNAIIIAFVGVPFSFLLPGTGLKIAALLSVQVVALLVAFRPWRRKEDEPETLPSGAPLVLRSIDKPTVDTGQWSPELLRTLEWRRFEELAAAAMQAEGLRFEAPRNGWIRLYRQKGDQGSGTEGGTGSAAPAVLMACRSWNVVSVGLPAMRALAAAMKEQGIPEGHFVTSGVFTPEAEAVAQRNNIRLTDGEAFLKKLRELPAARSAALLKFAVRGEFATPTCPNCNVKMKVGVADAQPVWACVNAPKCAQTFLGAVVMAP